MRSFFARMFLLLVVSAASGCIRSHYEDASAAVGTEVKGYTRDPSTPVQIQVLNRVTNNWDTMPVTATTTQGVAFWFTSYKLYEWKYLIPSSLRTATYRDSSRWVQMRAVQGGAVFMTFDRDEATVDPFTDPEACIGNEYARRIREDIYEYGVDLYLDGDEIPHVLRQQPFIDCGLQTGSDGILRLRIN